MTARLSVSNFFKYYVIHPRSKKLTKKDRNKATICSIAAAFLLGIPHLVAKLKKFNLHPITPANSASIAKAASSSGLFSSYKKVKNDDRDLFATHKDKKTLSDPDEPTANEEDVPSSPSLSRIASASKDKKTLGDQLDASLTFSRDLPDRQLVGISRGTIKENLDLTRQMMQETLSAGSILQSIGCFGKVKFSRNVSIVKDDKLESLLYVKMPMKKKGFQKETMKYDAIAYLIDCAFNFGIVPPSFLVQKDTPIDTSFIRKNEFFFKFPFIMQTAIEIEASQQIHLNKEFAKDAINKEQIQKAILFNIIAGKHDGRPDNTVIDTKNHVYEIDNEQIGFCKTDSWMKTVYADLVFDQDIIENVINTPESILVEVFDLFEEEYKLTLEDGFKDNILNNFKKVCRFFNTHGTANIQVQDLIFN